MRRGERHQQEQTMWDEAVFTESAAVKVSYILLRKITPSRHNHAIQKTHTLDSRPLIVLNSCAFKSWKKFPTDEV
jgi:hypothetical protein